MPESWRLLSEVLLYACWGAFCLVWVVGAVLNQRFAPPVARRGGRWGSGLLVGVAVWLVWLAVPRSWWALATYRAGWLGVLGALLLVTGTGFTLWARWRLGVMWTSSPVLKRGHQLRTDGPYAITRHPIYTGLLGMLAGTTLVSGLGFWLVVLVLGVAFVEVKLRAEERLLTEQFPRDYPRFRGRVPRLVPLRWPR